MTRPAPTPPAPRGRDPQEHTEDVHGFVAERCRIGRAKAITGLPSRTLQGLAAQGKVPGAAKLGTRWTFNVVELRRWVAEQEEACRRTCTAAAGSGGRAFKSEARTVDEAYAQVLGLRR